MEPPTARTAASTHVVSRQSQAQDHQRQGAPPVPGTDPSALIPAEAAAVADVYTWWTGKGRAPWMIGPQAQAIQVLNRHARRRDQKSKRAALRKKKRGNPADPTATTSTHGTLPSGMRRTTTGNALYRLDSDLSLSIAAVSKHIPFCGKTMEIQSQDGPPLDPKTAFRVVLLFWAPTKLVAAQRSLRIAGSSESTLIRMLDTHLRQQAFSTILTVVYLLPRWENNLDKAVVAQGGARSKNKFMAAPPSVLAYGLWQLGLRLCLLKPHVIVSTNTNLARVVGCTGGLDVSCLCTPEGKKAVFDMPVPAREPSVSEPCSLQPPTTAAAAVVGEDPEQKRDWEATCLKAPIQRTVLNLKKPSAPPVQLKHPGRGDALYHLRCPHPFLLTRKPRDQQEVANQVSDRGWFRRTIDRLVAIGKHTVGAAAATQQRQRVVLRLGKRKSDANKDRDQRPSKRQRFAPDVVEEIQSSPESDESSDTADAQGGRKQPQKRNPPQRQCYLVPDESDTA